MKKGLYIRIAISFIMGIVGAYFYNKLPNTVPIHWGIDGKPDGYGSKNIVIILFPLLTLILTLLFPIFMKIDPKKKNYEKFLGSWEILQYIIILFFAYIYFVVIYLILNPEISINTFMMFGVGVLFIVIGNYMGKIKQNFFIGVKLPWTLDNEDVWNKTHRFSGKIFMISGIIFIINAFFLFHIGIMFILLISMILFLPIIYSYLIHKKITKK